MEYTFKHRSGRGERHRLSSNEAAMVVAKINKDHGKHFTSLAQAERFLNRHPELWQEYEILLPESGVVRKLNQILGTDFKTVLEVTHYLEENPEAGKRLDEWEEEA